MSRLVARAGRRRGSRMAAYTGKPLERAVRKRVPAAHVQQHMQTMLVGITDASGRFCYLNPAGRALIGLKDGDAPGATTIFDCHPEAAQRQMREEAIPQALKNGIWTGKSVLRTGDGREIETSQVIFIHCDTHGFPDGFSVIEQDVSEWLKREQAFLWAQEDLRDVSSQLLTVQETERQRIAGDLHDGIGPSLILLKLQISNAAGQLAAGAVGEVQQMLQGLIPKVQETLDEVRRVAMDLRPSCLNDLGLLPTLSWFFRELEQASRNVGVEKDFSILESDVRPDLKITIFRILQEAVGNIVKHAGARRIRASLKNEAGALCLSIEDDGKGFDPCIMDPHRHAERGLGLRSMNERAQLSGGVFTLKSAVGLGTFIQIAWPP